MEVSPALVGNVLVIRQLNKHHPQPYDVAMQKLGNLTKQQKLEAGHLPEQVWDDLFATKHVHWTKQDLATSTLFVNKIYKTLIHQKGSLGKPMEEVLDEYHTGVLSQRDRDIIDRIKERLEEDPRIIVLTTDEEQYAILDGWRTAVAFILAERPIPAFVGKAQSFVCFTHHIESNL